MTMLPLTNSFPYDKLRACRGVAQLGSALGSGFSKDEPWVTRNNQEERLKPKGFLDTLKTGNLSESGEKRGIV